MTDTQPDGTLRDEMERDAMIDTIAGLEKERDSLLASCQPVAAGEQKDSEPHGEPTLNSNALATLIFNHCVEVKFGCGKESLWQRDIQQIIDEWIADTGPSEECLMADCRNPQEHFCFQHCLEVYGTKLAQQEGREL